MPAGGVVASRLFLALPLALFALAILLTGAELLSQRRGLQPAVPPWSLLFESTLGPVERPAGVTVAPDGTAYVVDADRGQVMVFAREGELVRTFGLEAEQAEPGAGLMANPLGVAVDPEGRVYVSDLTSGRIATFESDGRIAGYFAAEALRAEGIRAGALTASEGGLLVSDLAAHRVVLLGWDGTLQRSFAPPADQPLSYPNGAWVAPDGRVLVSDTNHDRIVAFSADGAFLGTVADGLVNPRGLVGDGDGRLFVATPLSHRVVVVDIASGRELEVLTGARGQGFGFPTAVALDGDRLLVTDRAAAGVHVFRIKGGAR